jgi:hypothetical protein
MARLINGALTVDAFVPTGNPGEYTFENALFNNQADATGNGAFDVQTGFVLFVPASDPNTFLAIPGLLHRYKLTAVVVTDVNTMSGTLLWDEVGAEVDAPTNGVACLIAETTTESQLAIPAIDVGYPDVAAGSTLAAILNDQRNIVDLAGGKGAPGLAPFRRMMQAGILTYVLPTLPVNNNLIVFINGVSVSYIVVGVNLTITEYTAGTIDNTDALEVWYPI